MCRKLLNCAQHRLELVQKTTCNQFQKINQSLNFDKFDFFILFAQSIWVVNIIRYPLRLGDAWWTPVRGIALLIDPQKHGTSIESFIKSTVHIDSVKLFPTLLEALHSLVIGSWYPINSRILGIACWMTCYWIIDRHISRVVGRENGRYRVLRFFILSAFLLGGGGFRFGMLFSIHRALPALCGIISASLLFRDNSNRLPVNYVVYLSLLSIISQWSFAHGSVLMVLIAACLFAWRNWKSLGFFVLISSISSFAYKSILSSEAGMVSCQL